MKKLLSILLIAVLFAGCGTATPHAEDVSHEIMDGEAITIPENVSDFAYALFEATDMTVNQVVNTNVKKKPEFISFELSSDVMLSREEKSLLLEAFKVYGVEVTEGLRSSLTDIDRGITVSFTSIESTQTSDCDLTIPVRVYYGKNIYTYCCDFMKENGNYILFRFEYLNRTRYQY